MCTYQSVQCIEPYRNGVIFQIVQAVANLSHRQGGVPRNYPRDRQIILQPRDSTRINLESGGVFSKSVMRARIRKGKMHAHYFQHVPFEGLGCMEAWLQEAGYEISVTRWYAGERAPDPVEIDLLIAMGGPMSVNDEASFPWLREEKDFIRRWVEADRSLLGVCLGAQLIASALGARVYPNPVKEIGWFPVTAVNPVGGTAFRFPSEQRVFHWHGETFDLPAGAIHLARSAGCEHQAFQVGRRVIGLQFHLETTPGTAAALIANCRNELVPDRYVQDETMLLDEPQESYRAINALMARLLAYITISLEK